MADPVAEALRDGRISNETATYLASADHARFGGGYVSGTDVYIPPSPPQPPSPSEEERSSGSTSCWSSDESLRAAIAGSNVRTQISAPAPYVPHRSSSTPPEHKNSNASRKRKRSSDVSGSSWSSDDSPEAKRIRASIDRRARVEAKYDFGAESARLEEATASQNQANAEWFSTMLTSAEVYAANLSTNVPSNDADVRNGYRYSASQNSPYAHIWTDTDLQVETSPTSRRLQGVLEEYRETMNDLVAQMQELNHHTRPTLSDYDFCLLANLLLGQGRDTYTQYEAQWNDICGQTSDRGQESQVVEGESATFDRGARYFQAHTDDHDEESAGETYSPVSATSGEVERWQRENATFPERLGRVAARPPPQRVWNDDAYLAYQGEAPNREADLSGYEGDSALYENEHSNIYDEEDGYGEDWAYRHGYEYAEEDAEEFEYIDNE